jgi:hypothetical protein
MTEYARAHTRTIEGERVRERERDREREREGGRERDLESIYHLPLVVLSPANSQIWSSLFLYS